MSSHADVSRLQAMVDSFEQILTAEREQASQKQSELEIQVSIVKS